MINIELLKPFIVPDKWEEWKEWKVAELNKEIEQLKSDRKLLE